MEKTKFPPKKLKISTRKLNPSEAGASFKLPKGAQKNALVYSRRYFQFQVSSKESENYDTNSSSSILCKKIDHIS